MLSGEGAEEFALSRGVALVPRSYFHTPERWRQLERIRSGEVGLSALTISHVGTVGAVARDGDGRLAAATSTGGMTGKRYNRIGDSPIIGAGTYADDRSCAVSATGHGEVFIPRRGGARHLFADALRRPRPGRSGARSRARGTHPIARRGRSHRDRRPGRDRHGIQFRGHVSRQQTGGRSPRESRSIGP